MTDEAKRTMVKTLYGVKADGTSLSDGEVTPYLEIAKSIVLNKYDPFGETEEVPTRYEILECRIAVFLLVKQGAEGEIQHTENGVTSIYGQQDVPDELMREIVPKVGMIK